MGLVEDAAEHFATLRAANRAFTKHYPGERVCRQPVHTVYGGAHLFRADTALRLGERARAALDRYGGDPVRFALGVGFVDGELLKGVTAKSLRARYRAAPEMLQAEQPALWLACRVHEGVRAKLEREAVEDLRIDFEDGFGVRSDDEEDQVARAAARELATGLERGTLPPFTGIRIKSFSEESAPRGARTLELFLDTLLSHGGRVLPPNFVVTLPKVTVPEQPATLVRLCELAEQRFGLEPGSLRLELMVEVTQALLGPDGRSPLPGLLAACGGRCVGVHFGTYDFTASCNVTAAQQTMDHPLCDLARGLMRFAFGGTGVFLSDGGTNVMPVGPHRGDMLSQEQELENMQVVHRAWRVSRSHIEHSLRHGYYQGWDLHPAQLPVRYAACYAFFLEGFASAAERLRGFVEQAAQATRVGDIFDDAATGQGLLNYFLRALNCGALVPDELAATGLTQEEIELRSFAQILAARKARLGVAAPSGAEREGVS